MKTRLEIMKARRQQSILNSQAESLKEYEAAQARIQKTMKQIFTALQVHDKMASTHGGHNWSHVGDLRQIEKELNDIRDRLMGTGEYAELGKTW